MDIGLLSVSMNVYSTKRIAEEAEKRGHYIERVDHSKCSVKLGKGKPQIYLGEEEITNEFDAIIPRIGAKVSRHGAAIVKQFEMNGIFSTARSEFQFQRLCFLLIQIISKNRFRFLAELQ